MIRGYLPLILAVLLIASLTLVEGIFMKDRWGSPGVEATELGKQFENVPKEIGPWSGQDLPVEEIVKKTSGAVSYVSRQYVHNSTGQAVRLWLVVGHSRDIVRHTPNICYPASGFRQDGVRLKQHFELADGESADFYTAKFEKEDEVSRLTERVFWAWNRPDLRKWEAPEDTFLIDGPRYHYGLSRGLYKLYFTSTVMAEEKTADDNAAADFAKIMLPAIDAALFPKSQSAEPQSPETPPAETTEDVATTTAADAPVDL